MAKRKLRQSKKALLSRLYYQKTKLKQISKEYEKYADRDNKKKVLYHGKKRTHKTIANLILEDGKRLNNLISQIENKIKNYTSKERFKKENIKSIKKKKQRGDILKEVGNVWHRKEFDQHINLSRVKAVNGFTKKFDYDRIHSLTDEMFLRMDSKDIACILEKPDGTATIFLIKDSQKEEEEED